MNKDYEVFISYRHKDCNPLAKALHDRLLYRYHINAFRDDEGLHFGDFSPEKSGETGLKILKNFADLGKEQV